MGLDFYLELPGCEHCGSDAREVLHRNITHNLVPMHKLVNTYDACYMSAGREAQEIRQQVLSGIDASGERYNELCKLEPNNGWGDVSSFRNFLAAVYNACTQYPNAIIRISK